MTTLYNYIMIKTSNDFMNATSGGYYLVRNYKDSNPYSIITDLSFEEADKVSRQAYPQRTENYMTQRYDIDAWLRKKATEKDVTMDREHPISFSLVNDLKKWEQSLNPNDGRIIIPFKDVDLSSWSFTLDDSFVSAPESVTTGNRDWTEQYGKNDLHGKVFDQNEIIGILKDGKFPEGEIGGTPRYFEAQLWGDVPKLIHSLPTNDFQLKPPTFTL